jgi:hypothetical protein
MRRLQILWDEMEELMCDLGFDLCRPTPNEQPPSDSEDDFPLLLPPVEFQDVDPSETTTSTESREEMPYRPAWSMRRPPAAVRDPVFGPSPGLLSGGSKWTVFSRLMEPPDSRQEKALTEAALDSSVPEWPLAVTAQMEATMNSGADNGWSPIKSGRSWLRGGVMDFPLTT